MVGDTVDFVQQALCDSAAKQILALAEFYVSACEPIKALRLLEDVPSFLRGYPPLLEKQRAVAQATWHLESEDAYEKFYSQLSSEESTYGGSFKDVGLLTLPRAKILLDIVARKPHVETILAVGTGDGILEKALLEAFPRITTLWVSDLGAETSLGVQALLKAFPTRVRVAPPLGLKSTNPTTQCDLAYAFEVLEHVIDPRLFVEHLVASSSEVIVSCPDQIYWVESYHNNPNREPTIQHVRGITARDLCLWFGERGYVGPVITIGGNLIGQYSRVSNQPISIGEDLTITDTDTLRAALTGPPMIRDAYAALGVTLYDARVLSTNGVSFLPPTWKPQWI